MGLLSRQEHVRDYIRGLRFNVQLLVGGGTIVDRMSYFSFQVHG